MFCASKFSQKHRAISYASQSLTSFSPFLLFITPKVSGEPPNVPVVSRKSGLVYEQRLIHKYINDNGKDPVTGDTLELDDLIELRSSKYCVFDKAEGITQSFTAASTLSKMQHSAKPARYGSTG